MELLIQQINDGLFKDKAMTSGFVGLSCCEWRREKMDGITVDMMLMDCLDVNLL